MKGSHNKELMMILGLESLDDGLHADLVLVGILVSFLCVFILKNIFYSRFDQTYQVELNVLFKNSKLDSESFLKQT